MVWFVFLHCLLRRLDFAVYVYDKVFCMLIVLLQELLLANVLQQNVLVHEGVDVDVVVLVVVVVGFVHHLHSQGCKDDVFVYGLFVAVLVGFVLQSIFHLEIRLFLNCLSHMVLLNLLLFGLLTYLWHANSKTRNNNN